MSNQPAFSDADIMKNTYAGLVVWVKELLWQLEWQRSLNVNNVELKHARSRDKILNEWHERIRHREIDLAKYGAIMVEDRQETVMKEYGSAESDVISNEELVRQRLKRFGGGGDTPGGKSKDWLTPMKWGTVFYIRPKRDGNWLLAKFLLAGKKGNVVLLVPMKGDEEVVSDDREWCPVEPKAFCDYFELVADFPPPEIVNE